MKKFKDELPLILTDDEWNNLKRQYRNHEINVEALVNRCSFWSLWVFYSVPVVLFVILNLFFKVSILYIPLYYVFSTCLEMIIEYIYLRLIPRKKINQSIQERERLAREKEIKDREEKMLKELQNNTFSKNKIIELIDKYKQIAYPKYLENDIKHMFKRMDILVNAIDDPDPYKGFFTKHLPEVLNIVSKTKDTNEEIELSKKAVNSISQFINREIRQHKLGISLDENSTLNAYINLYGDDNEIGGKK